MEKCQFNKYEFSVLKCETNDMLRTKACIFRSYFQFMYFSLGGHFFRGVHREALGYKRSFEGVGGFMLLPFSSPLGVSWEMMGMN